MSACFHQNDGGFELVGLNVFELASGVYSAACETFIRPAASSTDLTML